MNIQKIIQKIHKSGLSDIKIAQELSTRTDKISQATVNRWRNGLIENTTYDRHLRAESLLDSIKKS